jgi:transposase InsO family protein
MDLRLLAAISDQLEDLNVSALCREHHVSRKTFYKWRARFVSEGMAGLEAHSRAPRSSPRRMPAHVEEAIVERRKRLLDYGLDAGAATIRYHLTGKVVPLPSEATIWRVLVRRGFVTPSPRKRPRGSYRRFEASAPNECWQIDATEWALASGVKAEIINIIDDHSRLVVASCAAPTTTSAAAWEAFSAAGRRWGLPANCLSDNGLAFSGRLRGVQVFFEANLAAAGIHPITSRPYHPQTCGKVERFQQTLKKWLRARPPAEDLAALQDQLEAFCEYYNHRRPHRGIGRRTPFERWAASPAAFPAVEAWRGNARTTRMVSRIGVISLGSALIQIGREHGRQRADVVTDGTHVAVFVGGDLVRQLEIDRSRRYQASGARRGVRRKDGS